MPAEDTVVAVVTPAHGRHDHLARQALSLSRGTRLPDVHVVVAMDDPGLAASYDDVVEVDLVEGRLPLARARNAGAERALERGATVLVFLDVDCLAGADLVAAYADAATSSPQTVWSGPVTYLPPPDVAAGGYDLDRLDDLDHPHPARPAPVPGERLVGADPDLFWSLSFAVGGQAWRELGGFHEGYVGYGAEDTDFGHLVASSGRSLGWLGSARAYHQHHPTRVPPTQHLDDILRNGRVYRDRWGMWPMRGWLAEFERLGLVRRVGEDYLRLA